MTNNNKVDLNRMAWRHFTIIGICFIMYQIVLLYEKYFIDSSFIADIGIRYNFTYESIDLVYSGALVLLATLVVSAILLLEYRHNKLNYTGEKIRIINVVKYIFVVIAVNLIGSYISAIFSSYTSVSSTYLLPVGICLDRFDFSNPIYIILFLLVFPLSEELLYRKALLNVLKRYGFRFAIVVSSLIFALAHNDVFQILPAFFVGVLLSSITLQHKSVIPAMAIHMVNNLFFFTPFIVAPRNYLILDLLTGVILVMTAYIILAPDKLNIRFPENIKNNNYNIFFRNAAIVLMILLFLSGNLYYFFI